MKNKVGRPRAFQRDEALLKAMHIFWAKGYDGASMKDLTKAMGINSPSLYSEFGDKERLYLEAIECYVSNDSCTPLVAFETEPDIRKAVEKFLTAAIDYATENDSGALGCFLSSCVSTSAGVIPGVDTILQRAASETDARLARRFELEKARGSLASNFPSMQRARLMFDLRQGGVFRARAGVNVEELKSDMDFRVDIILA